MKFTHQIGEISPVFTLKFSTLLLLFHSYLQNCDHVLVCQLVKRYVLASNLLRNLMNYIYKTKKPLKWCVFSQKKWIFFIENDNFAEKWNFMERIGNFRWGKCEFWKKIFLFIGAQSLQDIAEHEENISGIIFTFAYAEQWN